MPGYCLSLSIRIRSKINIICLTGCTFQFIYNLSLAADGNVLRLKIVLNVHSESFHRQISYMAHRSFHQKRLSEVSLQCSGFSRRLNNNK